MNALKLYLALVVGILIQCVHAKIISRTKRIIDKGRIRYHYDDRDYASSCDTVMLIGVGTAMGVNDYDKLGHDVVRNSSVVFVMTDHNPLWMIKTDALKYAALVTAIVRDVTTLIPACNSSSSSKSPRNGFIVGGHSASGEAAIEALGRGLLFQNNQNNSSSSQQPIVGLFGLDPYDTTKADSDSDSDSDHMKIQVPAMFWGFTKTTCEVNVNKAAEHAYERTAHSHRVLYQIDNNNARNNNRRRRTIITHCIFTDHGCGGPICPASSSSLEDELIRMTVGDTAHRFVAALVSGDFNRSNFVLNDQNSSNSNGNSKNHPIRVFVGNESPKKHNLLDHKLHVAAAAAAEDLLPA